jgi:opacity protein-like surface antigen
MHRITIRTTGALLLALGTGLASAQTKPVQSGWYGQFDLGRSRADVDSSSIDQAFSLQGITGSTSFDRHRTGLGLRLGYQVNENFAVEGAYDRLGKFRYDTTTTAPGADSISGSHEISAFSLAAVGIVPLQHGFSLYGKAGLADVRSKLHAASALGTTAPADASDSRASFLYGFGAHLDIDRNLYARAGWERYNSTGADDTGKGHADMLSVGLGYRF